jgi:hypothetical protein
MTSSSGAWYTRLLKLISGIGSRVFNLDFWIRLEGSELISGKNMLNSGSLQHILPRDKFQSLEVDPRNEVEYLDSITEISFDDLAYHASENEITLRH